MAYDKNNWGIMSGGVKPFSGTISYPFSTIGSDRASVHLHCIPAGATYPSFRVDVSGSNQADAPVVSPSQITQWFPLPISQVFVSSATNTECGLAFSSSYAAHKIDIKPAASTDGFVHTYFYKRIV